MLCDDAPTGTLTIDGVSLHRPAFVVVDLTPLWLDGDQRGDDVLLPGAVGVIAEPRRVTVTKRTLPLLIDGEWMPDGTAAPDPWIGFQASIDYLRANLTEPTGVGDGTRTATLTMPNGDVRTGPVHVGPLGLGKFLDGRGRASLDLSLPQGMLS